MSLVDLNAGAEQMVPDLGRLESDETYVGYGKASGFHSPERLRGNGPQQYTVGGLGLNQWGLSGQWVVGEENARADQAGAGIAYQFGARDLHLVLGAGEPGRRIRIKVSLDGRAPGADQSFVDSSEFKTMYGAQPDNTAFLTALYKFALHPEPDATGLAWWNDAIQSGRIDKVDVLIQFSESTENQVQVIGSEQHGIQCTPWH